MPPSPTESLDRSLASGIAWTAALRWLSQIVSWLGTLYAARLLSPGDFGLVSMAMLAIGLARITQEFGLDALLVQDRGIAGERYARLAGLLLLLGAGLATLFVLLAPLVAGFFGEPIVRDIVIGLAPLFLFDAVQVVPYAELQRNLQFRRLAIVGFVQVAVTSAALVAAVLADAGLWSLVASKLAGEAVVTVLLLAWRPYSVRWPRDIASLADPLAQGWRILASRIAWYAWSNADQTIIGRLLGKDALGAYSFAATFSTLAQQEIGAVVTKVVPGVFSEVQARTPELRRYFLLLTELITLATFPMAIGLALTADLLLPLVLGDKWIAVVAPLQILCIYSAFLSSQTLISHVLMWTGQFRTQMWCSVLAGVVMPLVLLAAARFGIEGIAWTWTLVFPIVSVPAFYFAFRTIRISSRDWIASLTPAAVGCMVMIAAVILLRSVLPATTSPWTPAVASVACGALAYPLTLWFLFAARVRAMYAFALSLR